MPITCPTFVSRGKNCLKPLTCMLCCSPIESSKIFQLRNCSTDCKAIGRVWPRFIKVISRLRFHCNWMSFILAKGMFLTCIKYLQGTSHRQRRVSAFSVRVVKYSNKPRHPSLQLLMSIFPRKGWRKLGQKSFPISPINWTFISPISFSPSRPTCTPPVNSYHLHM